MEQNERALCHCMLWGWRCLRCLPVMKNMLSYSFMKIKICNFDKNRRNRKHIQMAAKRGTHVRQSRHSQKFLWAIKCISWPGDWWLIAATRRIGIWQIDSSYQSTAIWSSAQSRVPHTKHNQPLISRSGHFVAELEWITCSRQRLASENKSKLIFNFGCDEPNTLIGWHTHAHTPHSSSPSIATWHLNHS